MQLGFRISDFANDTIKLSRPRAAPNVCGSESSLLIAQEKSPSGSFGKKFNVAHLVGTVNALFPVFGELFQKLPAESCFTGSGICADYVKTRTKELHIVDIVKSCELTGIIFKRGDVGFKVVGEIVRKVRRFGRKRGTAPDGKVNFSVGNNFSERFFAPFCFVNEYVTKFDKFAQVGFFLNDVSMVLGASSGKGSVDERKQIAMVNFAKIAEFAEFFFDGEIIDWKFF